MPNLLLLASLTIVAPDRSDGFHDLVPELSVLDHRDEERRYDRVDDARLDEIERRLATFLDLPPELDIVLADERGGRLSQTYGLQFDKFRARLWHRALGMRLSEIQFSVDGERVFVDGLCFLDPAGTSDKTRMRLRGRGHYHLSGLPLLFRGLISELASIESEEGVKLAMISPSGGRHVHPGYATMRYGFYVGDDAVDRQLHVCAKLAVTAAPDEPDVPEGESEEAYVATPMTVDGREVGPASDWRPLDRALAAGVEAIESFEFPGLERVILRGDAAHWDQYQLDLYLGGREGETTVVQATVWRDFDEPKTWRAMERSRQLVDRAVDLDDFIALLQRTVEIAREGDESLGVFAVSKDGEAGGSVALVVTVPEGPVWDAERATLHVLRTSDGSAPEVVEKTALENFRVERGFAPRLDATSTEGHAFGFGLTLVTDVAGFEKEDLVHYRDFSAPILGGSGSKAPGRK